MPLSRPLLLSTWTLLATLSPIHAQQGKVTLEFLSFPKTAKVPEAELQVGEAKSVPVKLPSHTLSKPVEVPALAAWKLGASGLDAEGKFRFETYGQARALKARNQLVIVLRKGRENKDGFSMLALDGGTKAFGEKKFLIMNLARQEIAGEVGGRKFRLQPGKHIILQPKADRGPKLCHASLLYQRNDKWRSFFSTNWPLLEEQRGLVFVYQQPGRKTMQLHTVVDSLRKVPVGQEP